MESVWNRQYGSRDETDDEYGYQAVHRGDQKNTTSFRKRATRCWIVTASLIVVSVLVVVLSLGITTSQSRSDTVLSESDSLLVTDQVDYFPASRPQQAQDPCIPTASEVGLRATNEYGEYTGPYPYLIKEKNTVLVEPYKNTLLELVGYGTCSSGQLLWEIRIQGSKDSIIIFSSSTLDPQTKIDLKSTGRYMLTVSTADGGRGKGRSSGRITIFSGTIFCKYVKREIRELTLQDRKRFLDAAVVMWKTDTTTGRKQYGSRYTSIQTFVEEHALASNDIRCDAYHEGTGFLTHHLALQNSFDASLRSIDPQVAMPYWDFSVEGENIRQAGQSPSYLNKISPIFTDEWFGSSDENDQIVDSNWAHVSMPKVMKESVVNPNSYGYVRSYWNNNPDSEVTRHSFDVCGVEPTFKMVPSCVEHYLVVNSPNLGFFQMTSPGKGHGPLHVLTGGIGGQCVQGYRDFVKKHHAILYANITDEEILAKGFEVKKVRRFGDPPRKRMLDRIVMGEYFHIYRSLWRSHMCSRDSTPQLLRCPEKCNQDMPMEKCACSVPGLKEGTVDWRDSYHCVINDDKRPYFDAFFPEEILRELVVYVGTTPLVEGDMLEAASPADIMFWMIHPAIERMLAAKRLPTVKKFADLPMSKWGPDEEKWLAYSYYTQAAGENPTYPQAYTCKGHEASDPVLPDKLPFHKNFQALADTDKDGVVTNWEFYQAIDPTNANGVDYVFSNFVWDHCKALDDEQAAMAALDEDAPDGPDS